MNVKCEQFDEILERQDAVEMAALAAHAQQCETCALQLRLEHEISGAAPSLRKEWNSAALWLRIERAIEAENRKSKLVVWPFSNGAQTWRLVAAAAVLLIVTASAAWIALRPTESVTEGVVPARVVIG